MRVRVRVGGAGRGGAGRGCFTTWGSQPQHLWVWQGVQGGAARDAAAAGAPSCGCRPPHPAAARVGAAGGAAGCLPAPPAVDAAVAAGTTGHRASTGTGTAAVHVAPAAGLPPLGPYARQCSLSRRHTPTTTCRGHAPTPQATGGSKPTCQLWSGGWSPAERPPHAPGPPTPSPLHPTSPLPPPTHPPNPSIPPPPTWQLR